MASLLPVQIDDQDEASLEDMVMAANGQHPRAPRDPAPVAPPPPNAALDQLDLDGLLDDDAPLESRRRVHSAHLQKSKMLGNWRLGLFDKETWTCSTFTVSGSLPIVHEVVYIRRRLFQEVEAVVFFI